MKTLTMLTLLSFLTSTPLFAQNKADVESMLSQFVQSGVINAQQAGQANVKLQQLTPQQWADIKARAHQMKNSGQFKNISTPNTLGSATQNIDTSSAQFQQVMDQMKKAIEQGPQ